MGQDCTHSRRRAHATDLAAPERGAALILSRRTVGQGLVSSYENSSQIPMEAALWGPVETAICRSTSIASSRNWLDKDSFSSGLAQADLGVSVLPLRGASPRLR